MAIARLKLLDAREERAPGLIEPLRQRHIACLEESRMADQRFETTPLNPPIGVVGPAQTAGVAIIGKRQAVDLGVQEARPKQGAIQHPPERTGICRCIAGGCFLKESALSDHSFIPVLATPCTKLRRRITNSVMEGTSTAADAALSRPRSTVKPVWNRARPTSIV